MNRLLIPLVILLGSLLYSIFWNKVRRPECGQESGILHYEVEETTEELVLPPPPPVEEVDTLNLTPVERALFKPLDIYFQSGSPNILRTSELDEWLGLAKTYLAENPDQKLSLVGHTDSDGPDALNQTLSEQRADKVKEILVKEGFSTDSFVVSGKGETEPIADNSTAEGKSQNRRVSIRLIK